MLRPPFSQPSIEITCVAMIIPSICPSAGARAIAVSPMIPLAPGLLSTTTDCPQASVSFCAIMRATMSVLAPGEKGSIRATTREG